VTATNESTKEPSMKHDSNVTSTLGHLIDGKRVDGGSRVQPVFDPATGESHKSVALADQLTVDAAIASAQAAFPAWRNTPPLKRARDEPLQDAARRACGRTAR
jgi:malonate-semialdehyde dehydrogenase (acetylating)/methylmalonate-semialdehyde dehydrogenase